jgi:hypothetical protein
MSFAGDLEHLSIVDVVQLLHVTRKSGTLIVTSGKRECRLVFGEGFIISANHFDNSLRIGRILVEAKAVSEEALNQTLAEQAAAGGERRPLVAALIESGRVAKEDAYRGLETLLELTIVEVLTWTSGRFDFDLGSVAAADDYRYFPETLHQGIQFHTENVLMDALRIYDEKKRDGTLASEFQPIDEVFGEAEKSVLSADDLGLGDVDRLERKIPQVFRALEDRPPTDVHRRALATLAPGLPEEERGRLAAVLDALPPRPRAGDVPALSVILYGGDELLAHCVSTACRHGGIFVFSTNEEKDVDPVIDQCLAKGGAPVLVLDAPAPADSRFSPGALADLLRRKRAAHPRLLAIQLAGPEDSVLPLTAADGVLAVLGRPRQEAVPATFVEDFAAFLAALPAQLRTHVREQGAWVVSRIKDGLDAVRGLQDGSSVALALLRSLAGICERALTLVVRSGELVAERGIGFAPGPGREPLPLLGAALRIPRGESPLLTEILARGGCRTVATGEDDALKRLFARVGAPRHPSAFLVPLRAAGTTVSVTYADFGQGEPVAVDLDLVETLAGQAGLALECILYRKRLQRTAP